MTDYGKRKCELLEQKGFDANNFAWWVKSEDETSRTYAYVSKKVGSRVQELVIKTTDDIEEINTEYQKLMQNLAEFKEYLNEEFGKDSITCCDAETSNVMEYVSHIAHNIDIINLDAHDIEEELPWSEVSDVFDCGIGEDAWYWKDDPELFGEQN